MPARQWRSVDLPEPLGPMTATISPRFTARLAPRSAGVSPKESTMSFVWMSTGLPSVETALIEAD